VFTILVAQKISNLSGSHMFGKLGPDILSAQFWIFFQNIQALDQLS
jgi:hypothetical protein